MDGIRTFAPALWLGLALAAACSPAGSEAASPAKQAEPPVWEVSLAEVSESVWERTLRLSGELLAAEQATVSSKVAGRLEHLGVDVGTKVTRGEVLARIEARDFELRRAQAAASVQAARALLGLAPTDDLAALDPDQMSIVREARAQLDRARRESERQTNLVAHGAATQMSQDEAATELSAAESRWHAAKETVENRRATLAQREVELAIAETQLADTKILAPFDGVVAERLAGTGDYLSVGSQLARLIRADPVRLSASVPEKSTGSVRVGQELRAHFDSGAPSVVAHIARVAPALGVNDRTLRIEADLPNPDGVLRPGSFVRADLVLEPQARALTIPPQALVRFAGIEKVFVADGEVAQERRVRVGRTDGARVEVLGGLKAGEKVVLDPGKLQSGTRLRAKD